jgi:signal transduction histidine kinase
VDLEERLRIGQARERVPPESPKNDAVRLTPLERVARRRREQDLPAVTRGADASGGMHCDTNVPGLGECRAPGVDADADADRGGVGPHALRERALYAHRRVDRARRLTKDSEELIRARVDLVTTGVAHALPDQGPHVTQDRRVSIAELLRQTRGPFDVGEKEGHRAARQARDVPGARLDLGLLALLAQLSVEEADRDDAVLLRRPQQALARTLASGFVRESGLVEARQGVTHVRFVVDRQAPASLRINVREGTVGETGADAGRELWQRLVDPPENRMIRVEHRGATRVVIIAGLTAVYFAAGKLGLSLAFVHASATAVWPPTGIALAAFLYFGPWVWPAVLIGAFLVNLTTAGSALSSAGIAVGNTLEGLLAAYLVSRYANGRHAFERLRDVFRFAFVAALLSPIVSATFGVTSLCATGYAQWSDFGPIWLTWWLGDAVGALVVAPLLIIWANDPRPPPWDRRRAFELAMFASALVLTVALIFGGLPPFLGKAYPTTFLAFPVLVWAAFRFGPRVAAVALVVLSGAAIWGTLLGFGPFASGPPTESLLLLQAFVGVAAVMTLALAAAEAELRRSEAQQIAERDEFLAVAAHELKTPITSLRLAVQYLRRVVDDGGVVENPQLRPSLLTIEQQSLRLGRLVIELLETVRLRAGRIVLEVRQVNVVEVVAKSVRDAQAATSRHEIALSAPRRLDARIDALRFEQIVTNLLDNAIKFSPGGGRVEVELSSPERGTVRLAVRDHGIGITPEHRAHIFERFYQSQPNDQRAGLGLGLYVSRQIAELHGGRIEAEFPEDGGTRVVVWLTDRSA